MPARAPSKTPWLHLAPEFKGICKRSWQLWWSEMLALLESLGTPAKTLRHLCDSFPPVWEGVEMGNAIPVSQGSSITL